MVITSYCDMMKRRFTMFLFFSALAIQTCAASDVYLCVDGNGRREYKNTGATKGCKKVDLPGITTVPAPTKRVAANNSAKKTASPSDFPKVDNGTQKTRDSERKQILLEEKKAEEQKLAELNQEYKNGEPDRRGDERNYAKYQERLAKLKESIDRSEKNIQALDREIANQK
jgi:hypothetical protein